MRIPVIISSILLTSSILLGQGATDSLEVAISGMYKNDSVRLRWAPLNYKTYLNAINYGWKLQRSIYRDTSGQIVDAYTFESGMITLDSSIGVTDSASWSNISGVPTTLLDASYDLLFITDSIAPSPDTMDIFDAVESLENQKNVMLYANIMADQNWSLAENMGLAYLDNNIDEGNQYAYRLTLFGPNSSEKIFYGLVDTDEEVDLLATQSWQVIGFDMYAGIEMVVSHSMEELYFGYEIQRSTDSTSNFSNVSEAPFYYMDEKNEGVFRTIDSLPSNDTIYYYRIRGLTRHGFKGAWSEVKSVQGVYGPLDAQPYIRNWVDTLGGVRLDFGFPDSLESEIQGFEVIRGFSREGPYVVLNEGQLLSVQTRSYLDDAPISTAFYFVRAVDSNGYGLLSLPVMYQATDTIAPVAPTGLFGTITNDGSVEIGWSKNPENDVRGYKVFAANADTVTSLYTEISSGAVRDTIFHYQLNPEVMNEKWYVKVRAIDHHENDGPFSQPLELDRPDVVPPAAPVLQDVEVLASGIGLNWILGSDPDAVSHILERKEGLFGWTNLLDITNNYPGSMSATSFVDDAAQQTTFDYIDTTVVRNKPYKYRVLAYDDEGNVSSSQVVEVIAYDDGQRGMITNFAANDSSYTQYSSFTTYVPDKTKQYILLEWDYTEPEGLHSFVIYRSLDDFPFEAYESYLVIDDRDNPANSNLTDAEYGIVQSSSTEYAFLDPQVKSGHRYRYKIMAKHIDQGFSELSSVVTVLLP